MRKPLSNEQIQSLAPSAFAGQEYEKMSEKYAFMPTSDVIDQMRENGYLPIYASQSNTRIEGKQYFTKHVIRFRHISAFSDGVTLGTHATELIMTNSHDGTSAKKFCLGVTRFACLNGMWVSESMVQSISVRHVKGSKANSLAEQVNRLFDQAQLVESAIASWQAINLNSAEQNLLAETAHVIRAEYSETFRLIRPAQLLQTRRYNDNGSDLWTVFNRIQENAVRGGLIPVDDAGRRLRRTDEQGNTLARLPKTREVKSISEQSTLNKALWEMAQKFAELKTGK